MPPPILSKSRYLNGLQCPKLLWVATNEPERIPEPDAATQHRFDQGHLVGELARQLYPDGITVPTEDFMGNITMTKELMRKGKPLFEAGVLAGEIYARADILKPTSGDGWDIIEVKSSTQAEDIHYRDIAFQRLCWEEAGVPIKKCFLALINKEYVKHGEIDPRGLFSIKDVSEEIDAVSEGIRDRIAEMLEIIGSPDCPEVDIGPHCGDPYPCPLEECWEDLPENHVFTLYHGGRKCYELYQSGVTEITQIPPGYRLNDKQRIQCQCVATGKPYADRKALTQFLSYLEYPLYFLDFETFAAAIPLFDGTRPYQKIPFQFSLYIEKKPDGELEHHEFLAECRADPRPELLAKLGRLIGRRGNILAYNKSFEEGVLEDLRNSFPEYAGWVESLMPRFIDLIEPFRGFYYYHPAQRGSASLKSVLPALTGLSYKDMPIANGDDAGLAYLAITFGEVPAHEAQEIRRQLLQYCNLDSEGMVRIVERLKRIAL